MWRNVAGPALATGLALSLVPAHAQSSRTIVPLGTPSLSTDAVYQGWRAWDVVGRNMRSKDGHDLGRVRNVLIGNDGTVEAFVVEGGGPSELRNFVFRIPWQRIEKAKLPTEVIADIADGARAEYGLIPGAPGVPTLPTEFPVTEVVGDYARLQAGQAYGYVSDVVFSREGKTMAVLVSLDAPSGGGVFAFAFPGATGPWDPKMGYFGLPYVTPGQASAASLRVDPDRFTQAARQR